MGNLVSLEGALALAEALAKIANRRALAKPIASIFMLNISSNGVKFFMKIGTKSFDFLANFTLPTDIIFQTCAIGSVDQSLLP